MSKFKPMLAPNETVNLDEVKYPILASYKLDGIRCLFIKGEMLSRSLKPIVNKQLREKFRALIDFSKDRDLIIDGEIYSPSLTFQEITRYVMTQDFEDSKSIKKHGKVLSTPEHLKFYCFDCISNDNFDEAFEDRFVRVQSIAKAFNIVEAIKHITINAKEDIENYFEVALTDGYEGLILRDSTGRYKCGRGTIKEGLIYKVKPFKTFDAKIIGVGQSTIVNPNAEKKINELGRSVTSKKKGDRIPIEMACEFHVAYVPDPNKPNEGKLVRPVLAMTNEEKKEVWKNRESYIGKTIEYKGMLVGAKDVPRHPTFIRFRKDKD